MNVTVKSGWRKVLVLITFFVMLAVNALANILPLNGITTGQVSDRLPNLFTPMPYTFAIWGAIYLMLLVYVVFQIKKAQPDSDARRDKALNRTALLFALSSLLNSGWIFAWHYGHLTVSVVLIVSMLLCLLLINVQFRKPPYTTKEELTLRIPFGLYFGWVTVATVANITGWLVSRNWDGFGLAPELWTAIMVVVATMIACIVTLRLRNAAYGAAVLWALTGILVRHLSSAAFHGRYPLVLAALALSMAGMILVLFRSQRKPD